MAKLSKEELLSIEIEGERKLIASIEAVGKNVDKDLQRRTLDLTLQLDKGAKERAPVDTGRLRANIHAEIETSGHVGRVISDVEYAVPVHEGTRFRSGRPYLLLALRAMARKLGAEGTDSLQDAIREWKAKQRR